MYQDKIHYVPYDIAQLEESLQNGTIDGFVSNYQMYYSVPALRNNFDFIPFGAFSNLFLIILDALSAFIKKGM